MKSTQDQILAEVSAELQRVNRGKVYPKQIQILQWTLDTVKKCKTEASMLRVAGSAYQTMSSAFMSCTFMVQRVTHPSLVLCPAYPKANKTAQAKITLGKKPAEILIGLGPTEAHHALTLGISDSKEYILRDWKVQTKSHLEVIRTLDIARWLARQFELGRLNQIQWDVLDEIEVQDLIAGSYETSFAVAHMNSQARAQGRQVAESKDGISETQQLSPAPAWWRPVKCATLLDTRAALKLEGANMHHCVGSLSSRVERRSSVIIALRVPHLNRFKGKIEVAKSTVEFDAKGKLVQHRGFANSVPHPLSQKALAFCMKKRWNLIDPQKYGYSQ